MYSFLYPCRLYQDTGFRVRVKYAVGNVKHMKIVKDKCRLGADNFVCRIFRTCGLCIFDIFL